MRIVSPGRVVRDAAPAAAPDVLRVGPVAGRLVSLGWLLALAGTLFVGPVPAMQARMLALGGVVWGIGWARMNWSRRGRRSLEAMMVIAGLQAVAAMIALDPAAQLTWPFFSIVAALGGHALRRRLAVAVYGGTLALAPVLVAWLAPGRAPGAVSHAAVLGAGVLLVAIAAAALRGNEADAPANAVGDVRKLHARLVEKVAADPERFALLAMDVGLPGSPQSAPVQGRVARALVDEVRGKDVVTRYDDEAFSIIAAETDADGARLLALRLERAIAEMHVTPIGALNASVGIAVYPDDGRTADELLDRLDDELREARARRRPLRRVPEHTTA